MRALEQVAAAGGVYGEVDALDRARVKLFQGDLESARGLLAADSGADAESAYVLGQVLFERGDFAGAKRAFDTYWERRGPERDRAVAAIEKESGGAEDAPGETIWALASIGLWDDAIRGAAAAEATAEGQFVRALEADLRGDRDAARAGYTRALEMRPWFLVCLRRLDRL